ncbi:MAG: subtilisin-like proprotein convertase family protein [Phycisphaerales bacterium]
MHRSKNTKPSPWFGSSLGVSAAIASLALVAGTALGGQGKRPTLLTAPVAGGLQIFEVADAATAHSAATRIEPAGHGKRARAVQEGWALTAQIAVATEDLGQLLQAAEKASAGRGVTVRPADGVAGVAIIEAPSIKAAAAIARKLWASAQFASVEMVVEHPRSLRGPIGDLLNEQWHLKNFDVPIADVNAQPAWDLGYSGAGIIVGIVEGGFEEQHPDLAANYAPEASIASSTDSRHATSVAGVVAALGTNTAGGAGLAYNAGVASQYYGTTSATTATALAFASDLTDIKSNSWGPLDLRRLEPIPAIEMDAIIDAATNGRGGLGTVFMWAAGNGGVQDRVDYDSWASNRYTIAVGAIGFDDAETIYNELGSSMFVVAHSDGGGQKITTTDLVGAAGYSSGDYTNNFGGTSAASPLAAGAVALALEANPGLSRRDVMHLLANTARKCDPGDSSWTLNGAGHDVSERFGFGAVDAGALVNAAIGWSGVGEERSLTSGVVAVEQAIPDNDPVGVTRTVQMPAGITIEAVELTLNATSEFMGDIEIVLTSPDGTESPLARKRADGTTTVNDFIFTSFRSWDEDSGGMWSVRLADMAGQDVTTWHDFTITVFGTGCPADLNGDGILDSGDIQAFIALFLAGDLAADLNGDGIVDNGDIGDFVLAFLAGC